MKLWYIGVLLLMACLILKIDAEVSTSEIGECWTSPYERYLQMTWVIHNLTMHNEQLASPSFPIRPTSNYHFHWKLLFRPFSGQQAKDTETDTKHLHIEETLTNTTGLFLCLASGSSKATYSVELNVTLPAPPVVERGRIYLPRYFRWSKRPKKLTGGCVGWNLFVDRKLMLKYVSSDNTLTIETSILHHYQMSNCEDGPSMDYVMKTECKNTQERMEKALQTQSLSDIDIIVENTTFKAHRAILESRIPAWELSGTGNKRVLEEVKEDNFRIFLHYVYSGVLKPSDATEDNIVELLELSSRFNVTGMASAIQELLEERLDIQTAAQILSISHFYDMDPLEKTAWKFVLQNHEKVTRTQGWKTLLISSPQVAHEIFKLIIQKQKSKL